MQTSPDLLSFFKPAGIPYALLVLTLTVVAARLLKGALDRLGATFTDRRLVIQQAGSFARFGLFLLGGVSALLMVVRATPEVLLAVGGAAAVSVGFALKDLVSSLIAGLIILVDRPFQVGDRVTFEGWYGEISHIGLRSVRLVTLDDTQITIPNSRFLTDSVASGNAGSVEMMIQMDFHVGVDQDVARARQIVIEALTSSRYIATDRSWSVTVSEVQAQGQLALRVRAKAYVLDVRFEKAFETDVTERVGDGFRAAGIARPAVLHRSV